MGFKDKKKEEELITISDLKDEDWNEIRELALKFHKAGAYGGHMGKCWIHGFLHWIGTRNFYTAVDGDDYPVVH